MLIYPGNILGIGENCDDQIYLADRYWAEGNNVVHEDIHGNEFAMSWKEHCAGLEHFQELNLR